MRLMWDGRREAGQWSSLAAPLTVIFTRGLWLVFGLVLAARDFDGTVQVLMIGIVLVVFAFVAVRDITEGRRSPEVEK